jgi:hypothetical protein
MLRSAVNVAGQLDAVVHAFIERPKDGVLESLPRLPCERPPVHTTSDRGDDLGHGEVRYEDIIPALDDLVELVAAGFGQVELQQGAGVAVQGPGQPSTVDGPSLTEPGERAPPRDDPRGPWRRWPTAEA